MSKRTRAMMRNILSELQSMQKDVMKGNVPACRKFLVECSFPKDFKYNGRSIFVNAHYEDDEHRDTVIAKIPEWDEERMEAEFQGIRAVHEKWKPGITEQTKGKQNGETEDN